MRYRQTTLAIVAGLTLVLSISSMNGDSETVAAKKYEKHQATTQGNSCGNGAAIGVSTMDGNSGIPGPKHSGGTFCQNIDSQIQGDDNNAALAGVQH